MIVMSTTQERAHQLIDNIFTTVMVFDENLRLISINAAGENLLLLSQRKICGLTIDEFMPGADNFSRIVRRALKSKQPYMEWGMELLQLNRATVIVDCMLTPLLIDDECHEVIVELVDAHSHAKVRREESLSILHDAAHQSLQGMAHEIKNPLGGLRGAAQLLEKELDGNDLTEYTQIIINEADRLRNLVDRMITPNAKQFLSDVNIHEVLEYIVNLVDADESVPVNVTRDYDPSLPSIYGDREQLIQAFLNIIRNATQALSQGGNISVRSRITRRITIRQHYYKIAVQIEVIDDGPGVPEEIERGMFYPLVTGRAEGSGLGLSISQSLIQAHGGLIEYERANEQTIFRVLLPLQQRDD